MRVFGHPGDDSWTSLGHRRGLSGPALFGLDLTNHHAGSGGAAGPGSYPSPPMSGSPSIPPKTSHELAERSQGTLRTNTQDVYAAIPTTRSEERTEAQRPSSAHPFHSDAPDRTPYTFPRPEGQGTRPLPYPQPLGQPFPPPAAYLPGLRTGPVAGHPGGLPAPSQAYSTGTHHPIPDAFHNTPPKSQRKTKGHVASACVPCKKAHLRCDAQRPCSRCTSTNKEAACVDVQHKKRGRPRLRDDTQTKFEGARFGGSVDAMRRPLSSAYGSGPSLGMLYEDPLRRNQSYRVLKSQPAESLAPRFPERGLPSDANIYPAPLSIATTRVPEEPVAYLTVSLDFSKVSNSFLGMIGRMSVSGLNFANVLAAGEQPRASRLQQQAQEERTRKDPTYLPPIFNDRSEVVMQSLGFTPEEVSRYPLPWSDTFVFLGEDGQPRQIPIRAGLAARNSIYFIVVSLSRGHRPSYPTPSPSLRDPGTSYEPGLQAYGQPTPLSATFDPQQSRMSDAGFDPRQGGPPLHAMFSTRSPGLSSAYGISPSRPDYPTTPRTYQPPRADSHSSGRPQQGPEYQLPPLPRIRSPPPGPVPSQQLGSPQTQHPPPPQPYQTREDRSRMGIGGLLEHPETTRSS